MIVLIKLAVLRARRHWHMSNWGRGLTCTLETTWDLDGAVEKTVGIGVKDVFFRTQELP
ncbi:MAG TPA: hypothetical protein VN089_25760 [Duganella sp.]|nr:hypothetical protein [Duganella sp.]